MKERNGGIKLERREGKRKRCERKTEGVCMYHSLVIA